MSQRGQHRTVAVIADDLTGSTDTVVQFRQAGWHAYLVLSGEAPQEVVDQRGPVATSRSLDTRHLAEQEAASLTAAGANTEIEAGTDRLYIKVDSTMRGSIPGQVRGGLQAWSARHPEAIAVICPAYPQMGRAITEGRMLVGKFPLHESPAASDPVTPVRTSVLTDLLPGAVSIAASAAPTELADRIIATGAGSHVVVDASTEEDLATLAVAVDLLGTRVMCVGSAGLARHLARIWHPDSSAQTPPRATPMPPGRIVMVMSSLNQVSRDQADHVATALGSHLSRHELDPAALADTARMHRWGGQLPHQHTSRVFLLQPTPEPALTADPAEAARMVSRGLAAAVAGLVDSGDLSGLVLVGGDGAEATLARLQAQAVRVEAAAAEGVPLGRIVGGSAAELVVATKAGGFGTTDTLTEVISAMLDDKEA